MAKKKNVYIAPQTLSVSDVEKALKDSIPFVPTPDQDRLANALARFTVSDIPNKVFVLNGYAGTGKSSMIGAYVKALENLNVNTVLMAPTGRAAKVFSAFAGKKAVTIHKTLYRADSADPASRNFFLARNFSRDTVFIVDEASMISDSDNPQNSLLQLLVRYVYSGVNCTLLLAGDSAQLPPVGQLASPAISLERLRGLGLAPGLVRLEKIVRQEHDSGILHNATIVRNMLDDPSGDFRLDVSPFKDIRAISSIELEDELTSSWSRVGQDETLIITRSNWRANMINNDVRVRILYADTELQRGEKVLVTRNNYYWTRNSKTLDFIANGETATVTWMGRVHNAYGHTFADAEIVLTGSEEPVAVKVMLDSLTAEAPTVPNSEMSKLYNTLMDEAEGALTQKMAYVDNNPYYNAIQIKHSYCVTCHKAQGGQWRHVYIDMSSINPETLDSDFYRWLYTAITRATERVYLVNPTVPVE